MKVSSIQTLNKTGETLVQYSVFIVEELGCFYPFKYENILEIFTPVNKKISVKFGKQMVFSSILKYCSVGFILEGINLINY